MKRLPDFQRALKKGHRSYDQAVGDWWEGQSGDDAHRKAYRQSVDFLAEHFSRGREPRWLVDYACGGGTLLEPLARRFPSARIVALDGSRAMLARARQRLARLGLAAGPVPWRRAFAAEGPRIRLVQTPLPNFSLAAGRADAVLYLFPNLAPQIDEDEFQRQALGRRFDLRAARALARLPPPRSGDGTATTDADDPEDLANDLLIDRVIGRDIRRLLRPGGTWVKAEYSHGTRAALRRTTRLHSLFTEGALGRFQGRPCPVFSRYLRSRYRRSQVILDVFHQTRDPEDRRGGYLLSSFRGV